MLVVTSLVATMVVVVSVVGTTMEVAEAETLVKAAEAAKTTPPKDSSINEKGQAPLA